MSDNAEVERFTILGEELPVRVSDTDGVAREALSLVQDKIESIKESSNPPSNTQLALLCALNLAGELLRDRKDAQEDDLTESTVDRLRNLSERIDSLTTVQD